jgi:hypothetical protein
MTIKIRSLSELREQREDAKPKDPIPRHKDGRPKIFTLCAQCGATGREPGARPGTTRQCGKCRGEGKTGAYYSRTTSFIDVLEDKSNLAKWQQRMVALGLAGNPVLLDKVREIEDVEAPEGRDALQHVCKLAQDEANSSLKAETGSILHEITEEIDHGRDPGFIPEEHEPSIEAFKVVTQDMEHLSIEGFGVQDELRAAGTHDRASRVFGKLASRMGVPEGTLCIGDLKTGRIDFGIGKIVMQLAAYSRMKLYDPVTYERKPLVFDGQEVNQSVGVLIHMPSTGTHAAVYKLDLDRGWADIQLAIQVREFRNYWNRVGNKPVALLHHDGAQQPAA